MVSVKELVGEKLERIGRAAAMGWLSFGAPVEIEIGGKKKVMGTFALDLDCPWRIKNRDGEIVLASGDMFTPSKKQAEAEAFDWDVQGNNLFDEKAKKLLLKERTMTVYSAVLSANYDLTIRFSNGFLLECFVNVSSSEECWRLFKPKCKGESLIATGKGVEAVR